MRWTFKSSNLIHCFFTKTSFLFLPRLRGVFSLICVQEHVFALCVRGSLLFIKPAFAGAVVSSSGWKSLYMLFFISVVYKENICTFLHDYMVED